jgi:formamidopyrimidine-DNA glycosylase
MIEFPEAQGLAAALRDDVCGRTVARVAPPTKMHRFCWFNGDPVDYDSRLRGCAVCGAEGFGIFVELAFSSGQRLCVNDGINLRLVDAAEVPKDYQLCLFFSDGAALVFTVAMYGGIYLHSGDYDNDYYLKSRAALSPFSEEFSERFRRLLEESKPTLSAKAFLATEQRFPGIGNGVLQDILLAAGVHPKRKLAALSPTDRDRLLACTVSVLREMTDGGGRDTEKGLHGQSGGYRTKLSKGALVSGCPVCGGEVRKETYLGGSIYYCPHCQPL